MKHTIGGKFKNVIEADVKLLNNKITAVTLTDKTIEIDITTQLTEQEFQNIMNYLNPKIRNIAAEEKIAFASAISDSERVNLIAKKLELI